jgi:hypothetical protein
MMLRARFLIALALVVLSLVRAQDENAIQIIPEPEPVVPDGFDPYEVLGAAHDSSRAEMRKLFKKAMTEGGSLNHDRVILANSLIGDPEKKKKWDAAHGIVVASTDEEL